MQRAVAGQRRNVVHGSERRSVAGGVEQAVDDFFFSSRRRHTRCSRDWSSDVCSSDLLWCVVEPFDEFYPALQQFVVRDSLTRPAFQYLIHAVTLLAAKPVIREICVVNHLPDHSNLRVADVKLFCEGFKRAVIAAMSEPFFMKHVEWHAASRHTVLRCKSKPCFGVDKVSDQPSRRTAIDSRPWSSDPEPALVVLRVDLADGGGGRWPAQ